jgi:RNase P subunit RPR2
VHAPVSKEATRRAHPLYVVCPITKSPIWTRIATDVRSLTKAWHSNIVVACPHCKETHKYRVREAFAEAAISDARIRGEFFASWA